MVNNFRKQQFRGGFVTIITALLLVVSVAFSIIGYAASDGTKQQLSAVESRYTTIGAMSDQNTQIMRHAGSYFASHELYGSFAQWIEKNYEKLADGSVVWDDGSMFYSSNVLEEIATNAPQIRTVARSAILSAHVKDIYGLTSGTQNILQYNTMFDKYSYGMAVVTGRDEANDNTMGKHFNAIMLDGSVILGSILHSSLDMTVDEIVSMHPTFASRFKTDRVVSPDDFNGAFCPVTDIDETEFFNDRNYIFRCFINTQPVVQVPQSVDGVVTYTYTLSHRWTGKYGTQTTTEGIIRRVAQRKTLDFTTMDLFQLEGLQEQKGVGQANFTLDFVNFKHKEPYGANNFYYCLPEDSLPFYAEFTGTLEEFLESEEGQVWRDVIIPMAEINQQSATVMLVDDLDYLHAFNSGKAIIVEGRKIDPSEFVRGDKVCVVSSAYADYAGLEIGDTLNLDFYDTGYFLTSAKIENWDATVSEFVMTHNPLQESNRIGYEEEYTIVGIYSAPEYEYGTTSFYADTIFVPKASVPNAEEYEDPSLPLLNSVVLMNGTTEEFEEYMESQGFGGYYTYFDQDYSSTISGLQALSQNALRLVILAAAVFFVTAILFYYLNFKRMIPVAYGMRRMGQHPFKLWWQMEMVTLPIILIAVFGGAYLGVYFFEYVTLELFETNIIMDIETVKWLTLLEAAALCTISLLVAIPISMPRLMKRK